MMTSKHYQWLRMGMAKIRFWRLEMGVLLTCLAIVLALWAFIEVADEVLEGDTQAFDHWVLHALREGDDVKTPIGPEWLTRAAMDITALGGTTVLTLVLLVVAGYLWLQGRRRAMWLVVIATLGGQILSSVMKHLFARPRPAEALRLAEVFDASFPSGHAMLSAVVYLTLGALLASIEPRRRVKAYLLSVALLLSMLVGASRVYIGVHYPTDVMAGWAAGLTWALLCALVSRGLQRRGAVEPAEAAPDDRAPGAAV